MSIYDALDSIPAGRVAVSVDVPGWAVVNLDTGKIERLYVETGELSCVAPHDYVDSNGLRYVTAYEEDSGSLQEELDYDGPAVKRAVQILNDQPMPDLEVMK